MFYDGFISEWYRNKPEAWQTAVQTQPSLLYCSSQARSLQETKTRSRLDLQPTSRSCFTFHTDNVSFWLFGLNLTSPLGFPLLHISEPSSGQSEFRGMLSQPLAPPCRAENTDTNKRFYLHHTFLEILVSRFVPIRPKLGYVSLLLTLYFIKNNSFAVCVKIKSETWKCHMYLSRSIRAFQ